MGMSCLGQGEGRSLQKEDTSFDFAVSDRAIEGIIARSCQLSSREGKAEENAAVILSEAKDLLPPRMSRPGQILRRCAPQNGRKGKLTAEN